MSSQFRFISVADPMAPASAETRSATHSHAISHVHARRKQGLRKNGKPKTKNIGSCTTKTKQITASEVQPVSLLCSVPNDACDPFQTLGLPLSEQDYFLLAYYYRVAVPFAATRCSVFDQPGSLQLEILKDWSIQGSSYDDALVTHAPNEGDPLAVPDRANIQVFAEWMALALTDNSLLLGAVLLGICRFILSHDPNNTSYSNLAVNYQQRSIQSLQKSLSGASSRVTTHHIARAVALAIDAMNSGCLNLAWRHMSGVATMVEHGGGLDALDLPDFLNVLCRRCLLVKGIDSQRGRSTDAQVEV